MKFKMFYESIASVNLINEHLRLLEHDINGVIDQCKYFISTIAKGIPEPEFDWNIANYMLVTINDITYQFYEIYPQSLKVDTAKKTIEKLSYLKDKIQETIHNLPNQNTELIHTIRYNLTNILNNLTISINQIKEYVKL